ncbi:MAG: hypothetical protein PHD55_01360 [Methanoregula sp.]|nr:hypothetical protein [Methanoregula sp.]
MKAVYLGMGLVILMVFCVACSGCTSQSTTAQTGTSVQGTQSATTVAATGTAAAASPALKVGSVTSSTSVFGTNYQWMEYRMTTSAEGTEMTTTTKTERSTGDYKGTPAVHLKVTMTSSGGVNSVYDVYYDTAMKNVLGGSMTVTVNGQTITQDVPASQLQDQQGADFNGEFALTYDGTEAVTVPAGTYPAANKYTATVNNAGVTYWSVPGIPVPVKWTSGSSEGSSTAELVGWG